MTPSDQRPQEVDECLQRNLRLRRMFFNSSIPTMGVPRSVVSGEVRAAGRHLFNLASRAGAKTAPLPLEQLRHSLWKWVEEMSPSAVKFKR